MFRDDARRSHFHLRFRFHPYYREIVTKFIGDCSKARKTATIVGREGRSSPTSNAMILTLFSSHNVAGFSMAKVFLLF